MSNTTFKSVKSVTEQFSDLNVSGDAVIHERLFTKDLVATNVVHAPAGKVIKEKLLVVTLNGLNEVTPTWTHAALKIVAAEITGTVTGVIDVGITSAGTQIFDGASPPARVSSVFSQSLGESGSPLTVSLPENAGLYINPSDSSTVDITVKLYYYES